MTHALHLKYRPQTLAELAGQPLIQTALTNPAFLTKKAIEEAESLAQSGFDLD